MYKRQVVIVVVGVVVVVATAAAATAALIICHDSYRYVGDTVQISTAPTDPFAK